MKTSLFELNPSSREYLDRMNMIDNLLWDMVKIAYPSDVIEPEVVSQAKDKILDILKKGISK